jgi:hypothetical protein
MGATAKDLPKNIYLITLAIFMKRSLECSDIAI